MGLTYYEVMAKALSKTDWLAILFEDKESKRKGKSFYEIIKEAGKQAMHDVIQEQETKKRIEEQQKEVFEKQKAEFEKELTQDLINIINGLFQ